MIQRTVWANVSTLAYPTRTKGEVGGTHSADDGESGRFTSVSSPSEVWFYLLSGEIALGRRVWVKAETSLSCGCLVVKVK